MLSFLGNRCCRVLRNANQTCFNVGFFVDVGCPRSLSPTLSHCHSEVLSELVILEGQPHYLKKNQKQTQKSLVFVAAGVYISLTCPSANCLLQDI